MSLNPIERDESLKIYNDIWNEISNSMKKKFDREPINSKTFLGTKIQSSRDEATDFHNKEMLKVGSSYICLGVILIDFILKKDGKYYRQVFLKEC